jgi:SAM-dependent methyltransferase
VLTQSIGTQARKGQFRFTKEGEGAGQGRPRNRDRASWRTIDYLPTMTEGGGGVSGEGRFSQVAWWESEAQNWIAWARAPGHDAYWEYSPGFFREIVPQPGRRTLEIGCGEGRVTRDLARRGHNVHSIDAAPTLIQAAHEIDPGGRYLLADGASLPFADESFDLVVAYNSLMDVDDMGGTVREAARVLEPGGRFCISVTHPINDAGAFATREAQAPFVIDGDYLGSRVFDATFERDGLVMRFRGFAYSMEEYARALGNARLLIELLREPAQSEDVVVTDPAERRWQRLPMFLFIRAVKTAALDQRGFARHSE